MFGTRLCLLLFLSSIARNGATSQTDRIVGGWVVHRREEFPFQVSLRFDNSPHCGASIIDHRNVLTAAHCVSDELGRIFPARRLSAVVGDLHTDRISPTTVTRQARRVFVHERYNPINLRNDIAVVRIDMLTFDAYVNSVPISRAIPPAGTNCTVSGWGVTSFGGPPSNVLRYVIIPTVSFTICRELLGSSILTGMMCAGTDGRDSCTGDSGGPLVCNGIQVGVVSWGFKCGEPDFPGVYTNVEHYFTWIQIQQERSSGSSLICNAYLVFLSVILYIFVCNNYKLI